MKSMIRPAIAAAAAVALSLTAAHAELIDEAFAAASARVAEMKAAVHQNAAKKDDGMSVIGKNIRYKASLQMLLGRQKCSSEFQQVNGHEPLATCDVEIGVPGVITPVAILPFGIDGEFDSEIGTDTKVACTGGIRADAGLTGQFQLFVALAPVRFDYSKPQFQECFESVIAKLTAKDRLLYFDAALTSNSEYKTPQ